MDKLIIAVCVLAIIVVIGDWVLRAWGRPGAESTNDTRSHRRLLEEVRRHGEPEERG